MQPSSRRHDYSNFIEPFESGSCEKKEKKYKQLNISRTKRAF